MYDVITTQAIFSSQKTVREPRKESKKIEEIASTQIAEQKAQLLREEEALNTAQATARKKVADVRQARRLRRGSSSTIIAGRSITPNLTQLGQVLKKELGTGA